MTPTTAPKIPRHDTLKGVTSKGSDRKSIRMPDQRLWDEFGVATRDQKDGRSGVLREFISWYMGRPDAKLPERPSERGAPE